MGVAETGRSGPAGRADSSALPGSECVRRALRAEIARARERRAGFPVRMLDVGGGSGVWAVPLAVAGCQVTVVDASPNALAALRGRAREAGVAGRVTALQGDAHALRDVVPPAAADLVLGHGLLEVVEDVATVVGQLGESVAPGGAVSVLAAGRYGAALAFAHAGRLSQAKAVLTDPAGHSGGTDPLQRRLDPTGLRELLESAGLSVELVQGDGVFEGWFPGGALGQHRAAGRIGELDAAAPSGGSMPEFVELANLVAAIPELLVLAVRLHALARRPP